MTMRKYIFDKFRVVKFMLTYKCEQYDSELIQSAGSSNIDRANIILLAGADVNAAKGAPLLAAIKNNKTDMVDFLLKKGADVNCDDGAALCTAVENGFVPIVDRLIKVGANVQVGNNRPLKLASENEFLDIMRLLFTAGANIHAGAESYQNDDFIFCEAVKNNHVQSARLLLSLGVNANTNECRPLKIAAENGFNEMLILLLANGADVDHEKEYNVDYNRTALFYATKAGHLKTASILVGAGAKKFPMVTAINNNSPAFVRLFLDNGFDVHSDDDVALRVASRRGFNRIILDLYYAGANVHAGDVINLYEFNPEPYRGVDEPLRAAVYEGHVSTVKLLINIGANARVNDDYLVHEAASKGFVEIVRLLLDAGALAIDNHEKKPDEDPKPGSNGGMGSRERYREIVDCNDDCELLRRRLIEEAKRQEEERESREQEQSRQEQELLSSIHEQSILDKMTILRSTYKRFQLWSDDELSEHIWEIERIIKRGNGRDNDWDRSRDRGWDRGR